MNPRFSILGLMALVLILGIGFAALRSTSLLWTSAVYTFTLVMLSAAIVGSLACRGRSRLACLGFAVFGWAYFLTTFWLWPGANGVSAPPYLTKLLFVYLQPASANAVTMTIDTFPVGELNDLEPPLVTTVAPGTANLAVRTRFTGRVIYLLNFRRIGHSLAAMILGLVGAGLGVGFTARQERRQSNPPPGGGVERAR